MISKPPKERIPSPLQQILAGDPDLVDQYLELASPVDKKGRYLHFDELKYRLPSKLDVNLAWSVLKLARWRQQQELSPANYISFNFFLTPTIHKAISETDRNATTASLEWMCSKIGEQKHLEYLLHDLIEDEAISSSQLEGASTTTKVAKELLKKVRKPRNPDEKMVIGNFKMMNFAWENRHKDLTLSLIEELHEIGVSDIDDDHYRPGVIRTEDDVVVEKDGEVVHTPPPAAELAGRLKNIVSWVNESHHDADAQDYLHPLIKGIILHFIIGYEHPFRDGNGRVARALFYWYMFKNDFAAFRYIAISLLLKNAPVQYGKSYLYTETDEMDLTYFVDYQCRVIIRAINKFKESYLGAVRETEAFSQWLWKSGLIKKLSDKQQTVFQVARSGVADIFTINSVKDNLGCSYNTAATVLNGLVSLKLFEKQKVGREWVYTMIDQKDIVQSWKTTKK